LLNKPIRNTNLNWDVRKYFRRFYNNTYLNAMEKTAISNNKKCIICFFKKNNIKLDDNFFITKVLIQTFI